MSDSQLIIRGLLAQGVSQRAIGQAIGRDSSLISQVARGAKPGHNLRDALAALETKIGQAADRGQAPAQAARTATVTAPARRTTKAGRPAGVRRATTKAGAWGQTTTLKRQAVRGGAKAMGHALADAQDAGRGQVAATVSFDKRVNVQNTSGGRRGKTGRGGVVDMNLGDPAQVAAEVNAQHGGNFAEYVAAQAVQRGYIDADERQAVQHMVSVELRGW